MEELNRTPYEVLTFPFLKPSGEEFFVAVVKGTFNLANDGTLTLSDEQDEIRMSDQYYGEPNESALQYAADYIPYKPSTDILITGKARSKNNEPLESWKASVLLNGQELSSITLTGPREWRSQDGIWFLSDISKTNVVPLDYSLASGGHWERRDEHEEIIESNVSELNPLGRGLVDLKQIDRNIPIPAAQILDKEGLMPKLGTYEPPAGLSPIPGSWKARLQYAGTYDQEWEERKWPLSPDDFDWRFFQVAHPSLITQEYLEGQETLTLKGLTAQGEFSFQIPDCLVAGKFYNSAGHRFGAVGNLDTVEVDLDRSKVSVTWRMTLERNPEDLTKAEIISVEEKTKFFSEVEQHYQGGTE